MKAFKFFSLVALFTLCALFTQTQAQVDVKINPIGALFGNPDLSTEFGLSENFGLEGGLLITNRKHSFLNTEYKRTGFGLFAAGKYYFNPEDGFDGFGVGMYSKFRSFNSETTDASITDNNYSRTRFAVGMLITWKWVGDNGISFGLDLGGGRAFVENIEFNNPETTTITEDDVPALAIDAVMRLSIGYRFGG